MEKFLQKLLAAFVAGVIATSGVSAIAEKTGNTEPVKAAAAATEQTTVLSPEDLCLPEEYVAFLNQNNIQIVDGNIVIETAEQFGAIAQYYSNYLKTKHLLASLKDICDYILNLNYAFISDNVKKELADSDMITFPVISYEHMTGLYDYLCKHLEDLSKKETSEGFCSNTCIMFDYKIRKCIALEESYYISFLDTKSGGYDKKKPKYVLDFLDFYNFLIGGESSFPYIMSDLDESAAYIFFLINLNEQSAATNNSKPPLVQILNYGADTKNIKRAFDSVNSYIHNFPIKDK